MQKSITSFFGAPKEGAGTVPSPQKPRSPPSTKPPPKPKAKAKAKTNSKTKGKVVAAAAAAAAGASAKAKPSATSSPAKAGSRAEEDGGEKGGSPFKKAVGKRKTEEAEEGAGGEGDGGVGAAGTQKLKQKVEKEAEQEEGGGEEEEEEEEEEAPVQTKRLRRLAKKVAVEDSDDEMFGEGDGAGEKAANGKANAMEVDDGEDDDKENSSADPAKTMKARPTRGSAKTEGKENSARKAAETEKETDEEEPDTAAEEGQDDDDDEDAEEEEDEDDEDEEDDEEDGDKEEEEVAPKRKGGTVTMALMAGAKKAKNAPTTTKKKVVKGSTAASIVVAKTEDLVAKASWKKGQPVPFEAMAEVFDRVEQTSKRLEIQEILRGFLCTVISLTPDDLVPCVYLACNELAPAYEGVELGIGDAVLQKAIQGATGRSAKDIKAAAVKAGDLGEVAQHSTKAQGTLSFGQKIKSLSARDILESYRAIARVKGNLSQDDKINRIKKMLVSCKGLQAKYIIRGLQGKMRIGLSVTTVMVSLSHAAVTCPSDAALAAEEAEKILEKEKEKLEAEDDEGQTKSEKKEEGDEEEEEDKEAEAEGGAASTAEGGDGEAASLDKGEVDGLIPVARKLRATRARDLDQRLELATQLVKQAYSECPNLDLLIKAILTSPLYRLQQTCRLTPGVPVSPMLAKPTKSIGEVLQRLSGQEFTCEYKYDGVRAQVHLMADGSLRFFSRSSKDSSSELPDLIPVMKDCVTEGVQSYVIDTEVVAYDRDTGNLLPFQMLSTRGRKDVDAKDVKVKVIVEAFDILYLNGKSLLQHPLQERRKALRNTFKEVDGRFRFATFMDHKEDGDTEPIEEFLSEAVKGNCEGLMVKTLNANSSYEPSKRSLNWLKLKKDYLQPDGGGVGDSLDLVPIGAFFGKGKRTGKYGAYLLACYEPDREEYQSVCKIGTGFTDEILLSFWTELKEHTVEKRPRYFNVADSLAPDVWLEPHKVWEVKCADLSKSPVHKAAIGKLDPDRGISIRFPRLLRERLDKDPEQATTSDQILDMYESQDVVKSNAAGAQTINADDDWEL